MCPRPYTNLSVRASLPRFSAVVFKYYYFCFSLYASSSMEVNYAHESIYASMNIHTYSNNCAQYLIHHINSRM